MTWREFLGEGVDAQGTDASRGRPRFEEVNTAEVTAVGEAEDAAVEFQCDVDVNVLRSAVCPGEHFFGRGEPEKPPVEAEVDDDHAAIEFEQEIFSIASDGANGLLVRRLNEARRRLRLCGDGMKDVDATDSFSVDERAKSLCDCFDFR